MHADLLCRLGVLCYDWGMWVCWFECVQDSAMWVWVYACVDMCVCVGGCDGYKFGVGVGVRMCRHMCVWVWV